MPMGSLLGSLGATNSDLALASFKKHRDQARAAQSRGDRAALQANVAAARYYFGQMGAFQSSYDDEMRYLEQILAGDQQAVNDAAFSRARADEAARQLAAARARGGEDMTDYLPGGRYGPALDDLKKWLSDNAGKIALVGVGLVVVGGGLSFAHGRGMRR